MADFLNPSDEILKHGPKLPHWQQGEAIQFVTFRLGDSMPATKLRQWREERDTWLKTHPQPWPSDIEKEYHKRFTRKLETWLDEGVGACWFKEPERRKMMDEILMRFQGERVEHHAWVIMPNHLHLLFAPKIPIETLLKAWKGTSSHRIGQGSIWQKNYRDTLIRDGTHFANAVRYIRKNPKGLPANTFSLWQGPRALAIP